MERCTVSSKVVLTSLPSGYWGVLSTVCQASMPTLLVPGNLFSFLSSPSLPITSSSKANKDGGTEVDLPALSKWLCERMHERGYLLDEGKLRRGTVDSFHGLWLDSPARR